MIVPQIVNGKEPSPVSDGFSYGPPLGTVQAPSSTAVLEPGSAGHAAPDWLCIATFKASLPAGVDRSRKTAWSVTHHDSDYCLLDYCAETGYDLSLVLEALKSLKQDFGICPQWTRSWLDSLLSGVLPPVEYLVYSDARDKLRGVARVDLVLKEPDVVVGRYRYYSPARIKALKEGSYGK